MALYKYVYYYYYYYACRGRDSHASADAADILQLAEWVLPHGNEPRVRQHGTVINTSPGAVPLAGELWKISPEVRRAICSAHSDMSPAFLLAIPLWLTSRVC